MNHESTNYQTSDTLASCVGIINRGYKRLMKIGDPLPSANDARLNKILELQRQGYNVKEIAEKIGIHYNSVYRPLKRNRNKGIK
jgi:DNA-binding NarL/FixJ family response regulator